MPQKPPRTLPPRAKLARRRVKLSQKAASDLIGCSRSAIGMWETREDGSISAEFLHPAARAYQVRPDWLTLDVDDDGYPWSGTVELAASATAGASATAIADSRPMRPDREMMRQALSMTEQSIASHGWTATFPTEGRVEIAVAIYDAMAEGLGIDQAKPIVDGMIRAVAKSMGIRDGG